MLQGCRSTASAQRLPHCDDPTNKKNPDERLSIGIFYFRISLLSADQLLIVFDQLLKPLDVFIAQTNLGEKTFIVA